MSRAYSIVGSGLTVAGASTLVFLQAPTATPIVSIEILRLWASQYVSSASSGQQGIQISRQVSAFPTLTSATPQKKSSNDPASVLVGATTGAAGTCGVNASAEGAGTKTIIHPDAFNVLNGWLCVFTPEERIIEAAAATAEGLGLVLSNSPATTSGWSAGVSYQERG